MSLPRRLSGPSLATDTRVLSLAPLLAALAYALSCLALSPVRGATVMGELYAAASVDPWSFDGRVSGRLLGPALANLLHLSGHRYWIFHHLTCFGLLAVMAAGALRRGRSVLATSVLVTSIALSGSFQVYKESVGLTEPLTFVLLTAAALRVHSPRSYWTCVTLAAFNHEVALLFVPWLCVLRWRAANRLAWIDLRWGGGGLLVFAAFRIAVAAVEPKGSWSIAFFLAQVSVFSEHTLGMLALLLVLFVMSNGALLVLIGWHAFRRPRRWRKRAALCHVAAILCMPMLALDLWRFGTYLIVPIYLAGLEMVVRRRGLALLAVLGGVTGATFWLQYRVFFELAAEVMVHQPDPPAKVWSHVVPAQWPLFATYFAILIGAVWGGRWLARRDVKLA